jgi:hypothetical protein
MLATSLLPLVAAVGKGVKGGITGRRCKEGHEKYRQQCRQKQYRQQS